MTKLRQKSLPPTGSIAAKLDNAQANVDCGNMPCIQFVLVSRKKLPHGPSSSRPCASSSPAGLACLWCGCVIGFFVQVSCEQRAANSGCRNRRQSIGAACSAQARKRPGRISWTPCCPSIRIRNLPFSFPHHRASQHIHRIACAMLIVPHRQLRVRHPSHLHHAHVSARWQRAKVCPPISHYGNVGDDRAGRRMVGRYFDGRPAGGRGGRGASLGVLQRAATVDMPS